MKPRGSAELAASFWKPWRKPAWSRQRVPKRLPRRTTPRPCSFRRRRSGNRAPKRLPTRTTAHTCSCRRRTSGSRSWKSLPIWTSINRFQESNPGCPQCQALVPKTFDVCWNCGTSREGTPDPSFVKEPQDIPRDAAEDTAKRKTARDHGRQCSKCGSSKIIPKARILDQGEGSDGCLKVAIYGKPGALFFKDALYGELTANICGNCGHVELRVSNSEELYEHYRHST